jgi:hypothetical protein
MVMKHNCGVMEAATSSNIPHCISCQCNRMLEITVFDMVRTLETLSVGFPAFNRDIVPSSMPVLLYF